jgi:uncharacterized protein
MDTLTRPTRNNSTDVRDPTLGRRRRVLLLLVAVALAAITVGIALPAGTPHEKGGDPELLRADERGVYVTEDGTEITVYGTRARALVEIDGRVTVLHEQGTDRYATDDGATLTLVRGPDGHVSRVELTVGGVVSAARSEPYTEHEVTFANGDVGLAGTLLVPSGTGPHPGVAIVHGAEWATRETYRLLATHYARRGVAVLIYDKRGTGDSEGDVASATFDDLTADALAGHALLAAQPEVDPSRVGLAGFSQGGWIGALAARATDDVAFVVAYSASGFSPGDQHAWLYGSMLTVRGFGPRPIAAAARFQKTLYSTTDLIDRGHIEPFPHVPGFWFHALDHRLATAPLWEQVRQPVLGLWGAADCQVPAHDSARIIRGALERGGNTHYSLRVLDGADHGLYLAGPCVHELGTHTTDMRHAPGYLAAGADWIHQLNGDQPQPAYDVPDRPAGTPLGWHHPPPVDPAWYGHATTQTAIIVTLLGAFGLILLRGVAGTARRRPASRLGRLTTATAAAGLVSVLVVFSTLAELGGLGDLHAAQIVGTRPLAGFPPLFLAATSAVTLTVGLATWTAAVFARTRRTERGRAATWPPLIAVAATGLLALWASYWQLPWLPGGLL